MRQRVGFCKREIPANACSAANSALHPTAAVASSDIAERFFTLRNKLTGYNNLALDTLTGTPLL